jgi:ABC-type phosphate transport system substrate-binding protein
VRTKTKAKIGIAGLGAIAMTLAATVPAMADYEPGPNDIVGVGGDTPQFAFQFLSDGESFTHPASTGENSTGNSYKLVTFNATADGNARNAYTNGSTETTPLALNPTNVLRAGTFPVQRVQSSGAAITALLADTATPETINFVFSASPPTAAQQSAANSGSSVWGGLRVVQIATDSVQIAANSTTNAPVGGLSAAQLLTIYTQNGTTWSDVGGSSGDAIIPLLPPSGSSVNKTFLADLQQANGGVKPTLATDVKTVEQNDPTAITGATTPADAIVPFSAGRLSLWNSGYFHNPATAFPGSGTALTPGVQLLAGYNSPITDYAIFRQKDATATAWQPGGTQNWANTLFIGTHPFVNSTAGAADIAAAGVTQNYADLGTFSVN